MKRFYSLALFAATLTLTLFSCSQEETQAPMSDLPDGVNRIMFNFGSKGVLLMPLKRARTRYLR